MKRIILFLIITMGLPQISCSNDDNSSLVTKMLTKNTWDRKRLLDSPGYFSISLDNCTDVYEFNKDFEFYFHSSDCPNLGNYEGVWNWIEEDNKLYLDATWDHQDKFIKILEVNDEILHTIEYRDEEDEFTTYLEFEYRKN